MRTHPADRTTPARTDKTPASTHAAHHVTPSHAAHRGGERHHGHTHAADSQHAGNHHLLQVEDLSVSFRRYTEDQSGLFATHQQDVTVLDRLSVAVHRGEIVAVVGASGAGKSMLADCLLGLFDAHATVTGKIWFDGIEQTTESLAHLRGKDIALIPQSIACLDPLMKVGKQVCGADPRAARRAREKRQQQLFERYNLPPETADLYPFELSGGMARRALLCCALMESPQLVIADEPTVGLDVDLAVSALDDLRTFANEGGSVMLITHDIELALRVADRVAVFRNGTVVEETAVTSFASPDLLENPYSRSLWHALPEHDFQAPGEAASC